MAITPTKALLPGVGVAYSSGRADYVVPLVDDGAGNLVPQGAGSAGGGAGPLTDRSGAITEGGTAQELAPANTDRRYLFIHNRSDLSLWVNFGSDASDEPSSYLIAAGASLVFEGSFVPSDAVSIYAEVAGKSFTAKEG